MGGKGDDGGSQEDPMGQFRMSQQQAQQWAAQQQSQKAAADAPVEAAADKAATPVVDEKTALPPEAVVPGSKNLTGLGDELIAGLSEGATKQVGDQVARVGANPQTYATPFDPYTGTFVGQGPYNAPPSSQSGSV